MVYEVFGMSDILPMTCSVRHASYRFLNIFSKTNDNGGRGYFIAKPYTSTLGDLIAEAVPVRDVDLGIAPDYYVKMDHDYDGAVTYIHKVRGGKDIYFIANSTAQPVSLNLQLRGRKGSVELWNPQDGTRQAAAFKTEERKGGAVTALPLEIPALNGMFVIAE